MKKNILTILLSFFAYTVYSQIGIYTETPHASSALDVTSTTQGVLIPRMQTAQKLAIPSPEISLMVYDLNLDCVSYYEGLDTNGTPKWTCLSLFNKQFFYMPSINIPTATNGATSINLYNQYISEFGTPKIQNTNAQGTIPIFTNDQLYYYITYYDNSVINNISIDATGLMTYSIVGPADFDTYMNIVFVVK